MNLDTGGAGYFYVGLDYSPAFSKIRDFSIRESTGDTKAVYPYLKDGKSVKLESHKFDWNTPDPRIGFKDNMLVAMEGSVGYGIGGARVELEIGYERFKTKGIRDSGSKEDEADTVYLLAKELAYDVVTGQTDNLAAALAKTSGKDIVQFAKTLGISHSKIGKEICKTKKRADNAGTKYATYGKSTTVDDSSHVTSVCATRSDSGKTYYGKYAGKTGTKTSTDHNTSLCGDVGATSSHSGSSTKPEVLKDFVEKTLLNNGSKNWPTSTQNNDTPSDNKNDNAKAVAGDLVNLNREEKTIVAGLLAKTIEGGEVVEIRAVSSAFIRI
ncbi:P44/Msp2 family outer membrane protein [Anaplasma phagocytophilum str. Norway variant1]|uniref:P44/Msp2 family outer membrane protein n=1 Tax=Anaplasma phagocytophilum str. Norway variant1 TaxID=1392506 RepID=A0A7H9DZP9_ANAPH|nr:P44/Msp2 family outer membrane protein [Anaplasma phagocytophilum str. Norway variant1]